MYEEGKSAIQQISSYAGLRLDYVQAGGGNTSVKFDQELMAIKASGYTLKEITEDKGYVTVEYRKILDYYHSADPNSGRDFEQESLELNLGSVKLLAGMENKRPSVEVGFHSFLRRCVIHTHAVYANLLCCAAEGQEKARQIFAGSGISFIFIPYINPGFHLTLHIMEAVKSYQNANGKLPDIIFMENHGFIVDSDDAQAAIDLHEKANMMIRDFFGIKNYDTPVIEKSGDSHFSRTPYLKQFVKSHPVDAAYFDRTPLYPDQLVYLKDHVGKTILIDAGSGTIEYKTSEKQAQTLEEVILAVAFVINEIEKSGMQLKLMNEAGTSFINNWESEKYRAALVK